MHPFNRFWAAYCITHGLIKLLGTQHQDLSEFGLVTDILGHLGRLVGNSVAFDSVNPVPLALAGMQVC